MRTTVTLPDGGILLLGGMKLTTSRILESGVPFLSKIPVINFLFGRKGRFLEKRKLLIILKARILIPEEEAPRLDVTR